ncbi:DNA-methyltransferase [Ectopseudomonas oleovorans]|uniref:DNA-methyltransferase n=1 Tax=Ectopseudomonas oleovorans TaxID=301 RepID=UPI0019CFF8C4|nr:site-specific DNA-methyltransferase [Pseudomonas oleovorans]MBN7118053.1 DNA methyltransferase [Pseudomonas oleovorans]MBN7133417.1 DNA methyltransferase [Pseudomonas oleovorans]MBN7141864.1 DNA methyltransferase [Pseudomonas oleovorans]
MDSPYRLLAGDCLELLRQVSENSIDSIVTDPPYGISFMGSRWDYDVPTVDVWAECLRVLKPGAYLLAFGGTRTYHRLAARIEDAGFTLHPMMGWMFGQGFPKASRVDIEGMEGWRYGLQSMKPAFEPICFAQKPFSEKTGTANIARWGTGAINIDGCRIPSEESLQGGSGGLLSHVRDGKPLPGQGTFTPSGLGRWPANLMHDGSPEVVALFPREAGAAAPVHKRNGDKFRNSYGTFAGDIDEAGSTYHGDSGSAARFFYCPKATRRDRNEGCEQLASKPLNWSSGDANPGSFQSEGPNRSSPNNHPTVKPEDLMRYLCRLVTPPGGTVLDPYTGSGSTGKGALLEGFRFIGLELDRDERENPLGYLEIASARLAHTVAHIAKSAAKAAAEESAQFDLFGQQESIA